MGHSHSLGTTVIPPGWNCVELLPLSCRVRGLWFMLSLTPLAQSWTTVVSTSDLISPVSNSSRAVCCLKHLDCSTDRTLLPSSRDHNVSKISLRTIKDSL